VSVTPAVIPQTLIADAGPDVTVQSQTLTQLDGSNSDDPNASGDDVGPALNYDWTQTAGPEVTLNNPNTANPDFISPQVQEETPLTFQLIVSTDSARSDPDSVTVSVTPAVIPQTPDTPPTNQPDPQTPDTPPTNQPDPQTPDTPPTNQPDPQTPDTPPTNQPDPQTPDTPPTNQPDPQTPDPVEFQTVTESCNTTNEPFDQGALTIATDQSFTQIYKITPNPYGSEDSLYFVNNDFFDCTADDSLISLNGLDFGWYQIEILDEQNSDNNKVFDISINQNLPSPVIYLFEKIFEPNLDYERIPSQYIVWLDESVTSDAETVSEDYSQNGKIIHIFENPPGFVINMFGSGSINEKEFVSKLASDSRIFAINQDLFGKVSALKYKNQTIPSSLERISANILNLTVANATQNSDLTSTNQNLNFSNVDIAIIDTGISLNHPDLNVYRNISFIEGVPDGNDDLGHGTHIAGIAAAMDNSFGVLGVAPGAKLWAIKVCDANGNCPLSSQIQAIQYVNQHTDEIDIVNLSIENPPSDKLDKAVTESISKGVIYVVAAGNSNTNISATSPARVPGVITVSAISDSDGACGGRGNNTIGGPDDFAASFSNYGKNIDFAAPGVDVFSTYLGQSYAFDSGTSMAAPIVAGQAALYKSYYPEASSEQVISAMLNSSIPYTTACAGESHGHFEDIQDFHQEPLIYSINIPAKVPNASQTP
ncbi:MAG: S8 family serine peptidase, partial [Candidatus Nitrosocosmicus sp.]